MNTESSKVFLRDGDKGGIQKICLGDGDEDIKSKLGLELAKSLNFLSKLKPSNIDKFGYITGASKARKYKTRVLTILLAEGELNIGKIPQRFYNERIGGLLINYEIFYKVLGSMVKVIVKTISERVDNIYENGSGI